MREIIIDPEGQREDVGQVCDRQVYHEDHRLGLLAVKRHIQRELVKTYLKI